MRSILRGIAVWRHHVLDQDIRSSKSRMNKDKRRFKGEYSIESGRLRGWDYTGSGWYFITICTKNKKPFFGEIIEDEMCLSPVGATIDEEWKRTEALRPNVSLDEHVIMPNLSTQSSESKQSTFQERNPQARPRGWLV